MNKIEALSLLQGQLRPWRERSWNQLRDEVSQSHRFEVVGESGTWYQGEIQVFWDDNRMVRSESWRQLMTEVGAPLCH